MVYFHGTEYLEGATLHEKFQFNKDRRVFEIGDFDMTMMDIFCLVKILHNAGYIHCDLKPTNIMIGKDNTVQLIDFEQCVKIRPSEKAHGGTQFYRSSDFGIGKYRKSTVRVDYFAIGIIAIELIEKKRIKKLVEDLKGKKTKDDWLETLIVGAIDKLKENQCKDFYNTLIRNLTSGKKFDPLSFYEKERNISFSEAEL